MNFAISAEIYLRLARIPASIPQRVIDLPTEDAESIKCVRLEYRNGNYYGIATNRKIAAVYNFGKTDQPNAVMHLTIDPALIQQCEVEKPFGSTIEIVSIPELQLTTLKTTFGYSYPGNAGVFPPRTRLDEWPSWIPEATPTKPFGAMAWTTGDMVALCNASPSGRIAFPEIIDIMRPVILRDIVDPNWFGVFMANVSNGNNEPARSIEPAIVPEWWPHQTLSTAVSNLLKG